MKRNLIISFLAGALAVVALLVGLTTVQSSDAEASSSSEPQMDVTTREPKS